jgi:hypothetical protein
MRILLGRFAGKTVMRDAASRPHGVASTASRNRKGNLELKKGKHLMKTPMKSKRHSPALLLSILCAGVVASFLGGCAEGPYMTAYDSGYYRSTYYTPQSYDYYGYPYSYYGPSYDGTIVRSGVRYNDAYGPRYYARTVYGDW